MPIYAVVCPDCGNVTRTLVLDGCRMPTEWFCGECKGRRAQPDLETTKRHPWEERHGSGCLCCGPAVADAPACYEIEG